MVEMIVVLTILVAVTAGVVALTAPTFTENAKDTATTLSLQELKNLIMGHASQQGYWDDMDEYPRPSALAVSSGHRSNHPQLAMLFVNPDSYTAGGDEVDTNTFDPATKNGWRKGGYVQQATGTYTVNVAAGFTALYGNDGDKAVLDGWGNPIVLQEPTGGTATEKIYSARLVSAGPNGILETDGVNAVPVTTGDDIVLYLRK